MNAPVSTYGTGVASAVLASADCLGPVRPTAEPLAADD